MAFFFCRIGLNFFLFGYRNGLNLHFFKLIFRIDLNLRIQLPLKERYRLLVTTQNRERSISI